MCKITKMVICMTLILSAQFVAGQVEKDSINESQRQYQINQLEIEKENIVTQEKEKLKLKVEAISKKEAAGDITAEEAKLQKEAAARISAQNIENKLAIIDNKIALLTRGEIYNFQLEEGSYVSMGVDQEKDWDDDFFEELDEIFDFHKEKRYDRRTYSKIVMAAGFNNADVAGESLDDSPYKIGGSRFFEIGMAWKTRVFRNSNAVRISYGFNFQFNGLKPVDNQYFVKDGDLTYLEVSPYDLDKSKLRMDNIVMPVYLEFGPSRKIDRNTYFRYSTKNQFRIGIGGYAGFNYTTRQKLRFKRDGEKTREKIKDNYNTSNTIYGLAAYVGFGDLSLYAKYDLNPIFKDPNHEENNVAVGLRWEL